MDVNEHSGKVGRRVLRGFPSVFLTSPDRDVKNFAN